jgi:hypothetical protein
MIYSKVSQETPIIVLVAACQLFKECDWIIADPQFISFSTDELYDLHRIKFEGQREAYRVSALELEQLLAADSIDFDWTDVIAMDAGGICVFHLACIDAIRWEIKLAPQSLTEILVGAGFEEMDYKDPVSCPRWTWHKTQLKSLFFKIFGR